MDIEVLDENKGTARSKEKVHQKHIKVNHGGTQAVVIVALDGWNYNKYDHRGHKYQDSTGMQVRISMNAPLRMTIAEYGQLNVEINRAYAQLLQEAGL